MSSMFSARNYRNLSYKRRFINPKHISTHIYLYKMHSSSHVSTTHRFFPTTLTTPIPPPSTVPMTALPFSHPLSTWPTSRSWIISRTSFTNAGSLVCLINLGFLFSAFLMFLCHGPSTSELPKVFWG